MYKTSYERYSKLLDSKSEEDSSQCGLMNFASRPSHQLLSQSIDDNRREFQRISTKDVRHLLDNSWNLLEEVAKTLETITISTGVSTYIVDEESQKLHRWLNGSISCHCYDVKPGSILAAYSAFTKKLQIGDSSSPDSNYPLGIGKGHELHVLSLPVVTPNDKVLAVIDLYRDLHGETFSEEDQLIGLTITNWVAAAYDKHSSLQLLQKETALHQNMFAILTDFFKVNKNIDELIESIALFIKRVMNVSVIKFYRNIAGRPNWGYVYKEIKPNKMVRSQRPKRLKKSYKLISIVLKTHSNLNLNINNLDEKSLCYLDVLRSKGISTLLFAPIIRSGDVMGIIELTNKLHGNGFTDQDEEFLGNIFKYYSLAVHYTNVSQKQKLVETQLHDETNLLMYLLQPCEHDWMETMNTWCHSKTKDLPQDFLTFSYYPWQADQLKLMELSLLLLNYSVNDCFEDEDSMVRFVMISQKIYRKNDYHNFEHAFNVTHFIVNIKRVVGDFLSELEWKALIIAAFCHDLDHPGFTNNFLKATSHYMVELYQESVLENHHSYVAHLIIKELKLFGKYSTKEYKFILNEIHDAIISTDLTMYFKRSSILSEIVTNNSFSLFKEEHTNLVKSIIMTTSDLSAQFKPLNVSVGLTMQLYKEFYLQGDEEKALNIKPISMMDRTLTAQIPTDQLDFIMFICFPCADLLIAFFPQLNTILENMVELSNYWSDVRKNQGFIRKAQTEEEVRLKQLHERINKRFNKNI